MLISKRLSAEENASISKDVKELTEKMASCPLAEFVALMRAETAKPWNELRLDLYQYIPVLNRMDGILEEHVKKYKLEGEFGDLIFVDPKDETLIVTCLEYSYILLRYCKSKEVYNSSEFVSDLFLSTSLDIKMSAMRLSYILWERFAPSERAQRSLPKNKEKVLLTLTSSFPPRANALPAEPTAEGSVGEAVQTSLGAKRSGGLDKSKPRAKTDASGYRNIGLIECMQRDFVVPDKWKRLDFEYYNVVPRIIGDQELSEAVKKVIIHKSSGKKGGKRGSAGIELSQEGIHRFRLSSASVAKLPLQQILDLGSKMVPKERWPEFVIAVYVAKAYCNSRDEAVGLRRKLVTFKCLCLDVCSSCFAYMALADTVLEEEPALLGEMSELIDPENTEQVPYEASLAALRAFVGMSVFKPGCSDILRAWGGNMGRSEMFAILETILEGAKRDQVVMQQPYMNYVFNMVANFMDHRRFAGYLRSAGLMSILLELVAQRTNYRLTRSGPIHLIEMFIDGCPEVLDDFIAQDGFRIVIEALQYEVDFALEHPEYGGGGQPVQILRSASL
ncbi:hypothetical protein HII12_002268 [Brettanomyces bruxellensis]|uniref:DUF908 domain-containing protein n=1 Tax=Dekkera bruxellensis TaxID=5007 RepID=A0A8H6BJD8_DEKBR|nr:hypothetical protein HII12_002268 [Brettanomyces bruxellensis]